jgi:hypothetical protein
MTSARRTRKGLERSEPRGLGVHPGKNTETKEYRLQIINLFVIMKFQSCMLLTLVLHPKYQSLVLMLFRGTLGDKG